MTCLVYSFTRQLVTIKTNDFVKPKDQREFIRFGLARNRTFKKVLRDAFASLQKYIITKIPQKLFVEYLCRQFPALVTHFFSPKPLQLYTGWLNYLLYSRLCVYGLCFKPYTNDGFVLSWNGLTIFILFPKIGWPFYAVSGKDCWYANFHYTRSNCSFVLETFHYLRRKSLLQTL